MTINIDYKNKQLDLNARLAESNGVKPKAKTTLDETIRDTQFEYPFSRSDQNLYIPQGDIPYQADNVVEQKVYKSLELTTAIYIQAADLVNIIAVQEKSVAALAEIQNDLLMQLSSVFSILGDLANAEYNYITSQEAQAKEQQLKTAKTSGLIGMIMGAVEVVVGVVMCSVSAGFNPIGAFLILDGITRVICSAILYADPKLASNSWLSSFEQSGIFGIFNTFGENGGMIAQIIAMAIMSIATCGTSLVSSGIQMGVNAATSLLLVVSTGFSLYGMIQGAIDQAKTTNSESAVSATQAASAGLLAWLIYTVLKNTGAQQAMEESLGKEYTMIIETSLFTIAGLISGSATNMLNKVLANNKVMDTINVIKSGISNLANTIDMSSSMRLTEGYESLIKSLEKFITYINQNCLNKLNSSLNGLNKESFTNIVATGNAVNNLSQGAANIINLIKSIGEKELQQTEADLRYYEEITNLRKQLINLEAALMENTETELGKTIGEISTNLGETTNSLLAIINSAIRFNPYQAG